MYETTSNLGNHWNSAKYRYIPPSFSILWYNNARISYHAVINGTSLRYVRFSTLWAGLSFWCNVGLWCSVIGISRQNRVHLLACFPIMLTWSKLIQLVPNYQFTSNLINSYPREIMRKAGKRLTTGASHDGGVMPSFVRLARSALHA